MPKIVIREKDYTNPGSISYSNFAVVVPGLISNTTKFKSVADDNGIYEVSSVSEFVENVGKIKDTEVVIGASAVEEAAVAPVVLSGVNIPDEDGETAFPLSGTAVEYTEENFNLLWNYAEANGYKLYKVAEHVASDADGSQSYGYLWDNTYDYVRIIVKDNAWNESTKYCILEEEGKNYVPAEEQIKAYSYGNKIAYELLKLGYKVLYLGLEENQFYKLAQESTYEVLKDKANYDFRYILSGIINKNASINSVLISFVNGTEDASGNIQGRGDCIALLDVNEDIYNKETKASVVDIVKEVSGGNEYVAYFTPSVCYKGYKDSEPEYEDGKFPASFHYLACAKNSLDNNFKEWFAVGGYTRGIAASRYTIESTACKLGDMSMNALQPRVAGVFKAEDDNSEDIQHNVAVNPIICVRGIYYLWGNRTGYTLTSKGLTAKHFLNIRQLCSTLKKQIYTSCRQVTFDPNNVNLWNNVVNAITPTLEVMKANEGIKGYKIEPVQANEKATLKAKIKIIPIEAVEDFDIEIALEDSLGSTSASITE